MKIANKGQGSPPAPEGTFNLPTPRSFHNPENPSPSDSASTTTSTITLENFNLNANLNVNTPQYTNESLTQTQNSKPPNQGLGPLQLSVSRATIVTVISAAVLLGSALFIYRHRQRVKKKSGRPRKNSPHNCSFSSHQGTPAKAVEVNLSPKRSSSTKEKSNQNAANAISPWGHTHLEQLGEDEHEHDVSSNQAEKISGLNHRDYLQTVERMRQNAVGTPRFGKKEMKQNSSP